MRLYHLRKSYRNIVLGVIGIGIISIIAVSVPGTSASNTWAVTIHADGEKQVTTTDAETVGEVLDRSGISLGEHDLVEPEADTEITSNSFNINVYRSRPIILVDEDNNERYQVESAHQSDRLIAENSEALDIYEEDNVDSELVRNFVDAQNVGYKVIVERATPLNLETGGNKTVVRTQAETVGEMLEDRGVDIDEHDIVKPGLDTPIKEGMNVSLTRINFNTVTREVNVAPPVEKIMDNNRPIGYEEVEETGRPGRAVVTYEVKYKNGQEVNRKEIRRVIKREPEKRVVVVGNKTTAATGSAWERLRFCESGGNYQAVNPIGYYGAYQFGISTWQSNAPEEYRNVRPDQAPPAAQDEAAQNLYDARGWAPWPECGAQL